MTPHHTGETDMLATLSYDLAWESADYWRGEMATYGPDDDDGDGETDEDATPLTTIVPWDTDDGDDDRRFKEWERSEWDAGFRAGRNGDRLASGTQAYADGYDAGAWQLERIEAAALSNYNNWLTSGEWDAVEALGRYFGPVSFDGTTVTLTNESPAVLSWWLDRLGLGHLPTAPCVFGSGLAVTVRGGCGRAN